MRLLTGWAMSYLLVAAVTTAGVAADWPMWRCDAGRTASTEENLPAELHLQWVWRYPALPGLWSGCDDPSWATWGKQGWEATYWPMVLGRTLFVGSSHNDSVTALDVETGEKKWIFHTDGPVRLAPAGWNGPSTGSRLREDATAGTAGQAKVYVASDDGFLYCLSAADGKLVWKFRGAPGKQRIIGDERLISAWPARGGPVVVDGRVYFAAGIFPFMGTYIYALDAETGKPLWVNNEGRAKWGTSEWTAPQGPLAAVGDTLFIPNNRLSVTCLERETGKFRYVPHDAPHGTMSPPSVEWGICGDGAFFVVGPTGERVNLYDLKTGTYLNQLLFSVVLSNETLYWAKLERNGAIGVVGAIDLAKIEKGEKAEKIPPLWSLKLSRIARGNLAMRLRAGSRLYASNANRVIAVDLPTKDAEARETGSVETEGEITEVLAAAGRLFVVTREGGLYCFGGDKVNARKYAVKHEKLSPASDEWTTTAAQILKASGVKDGYAVVLGIGSGRLMEEMLKQSEMTVIGVDSDGKKLDAMRRQLDSAGLYGKRAAVFEGDALDCGLPPYLANLVVTEDPGSAGIARGPEFVRGVFRSLRPYGGAAYLPARQASKESLTGWVKAADVKNAEVGVSGEYTFMARVGALPGSASWTHQNADAGNTMASSDDLVRAPLGLLWFGGPSSALTFDRHVCGPRPQVVGGRIIVWGPGGLTAVDVYTGRLLWCTSSPEILAPVLPYTGVDGRPATAPPKRGSNWLGGYYVSLSDGIYVASGRTCMRLDPATGGKMSEFLLPAEGEHAGRAFGPIRIWQDVLVAAVDPSEDGMVSRRIAAFDRNTGKALWSLESQQGFGANAIAAGDGKVFCLDRWSGNPIAEFEGGSLFAADIRTGNKTWTTSENMFGTWLSYSSEGHVLLLGRGIQEYSNPSNARCAAYDTEGAVLWKGNPGKGPYMLTGSTLITQGPGVFNIRTGAKIKDLGGVTGTGKGCGYCLGSTHLVTRRQGCILCFDVDNAGAGFRLGGIRSGCLNTLIAADGVVALPYFGTGCRCGHNIMCSVGLIHMPELAEKSKQN